MKKKMRKIVMSFLVMVFVISIMTMVIDMKESFAASEKKVFVSWKDKKTKDLYFWNGESTQKLAEDIDEFQISRNGWIAWERNHDLFLWNRKSIRLVAHRGDWPQKFVFQLADNNLLWWLNEERKGDVIYLWDNKRSAPKILFRFCEKGRSIFNEKIHWTLLSFPKMSDNGQQIAWFGILPGTKQAALYLWKRGRIQQIWRIPKKGKISNLSNKIRFATDKNWIFWIYQDDLYFWNEDSVQRIGENVVNDIFPIVNPHGWIAWKTEDKKLKCTTIYLFDGKLIRGIVTLRIKEEYCYLDGINDNGWLIWRELQDEPHKGFYLDFYLWDGKSIKKLAEHSFKETVGGYLINSNNWTSWIFVTFNSQKNQFINNLYVWDGKTSQKIGEKEVNESFGWCLLRMLDNNWIIWLDYNFNRGDGKDNICVWDGKSIKKIGENVSEVKITK